MTKRKVLVMIITLMMCFSLCSCKQSETSLTDESFGKFVVIQKGAISNSDVYQYIMYDPGTMVMYTFLDGYRCGGPTVMYNADGTIRVYSPN